MTHAREDRIRAFLSAAGWGDAIRRPLAGDASDRRYERLHRASGTAVLMDAPPGQGDDPADFVAVGQHLASLGLSPPAVLAQDLAQGFLLLEDLGDGLFARLVAADPAMEIPLYETAAAVLAEIARHPVPPGRPDLSARGWAEAAAFALDWYRFAATGERLPTGPFVDAMEGALRAHAEGPRVLILRDFHAENLLWLPDRRGLARVGLLDFQLGQGGQPGYDLVSLIQDARRDVSDAAATAAVLAYTRDTGQTAADLAPRLAVLGAQRALRILGVFARLCLVAGKPGYLPLIPRVWAQLQTNLRHPALAPLADICDPLLPAPTPETLTRIEAQCATAPSR